MKKLFVVFILMAMFACEEEDFNSQLKSIKYGTSFGKCLGYCLTDIEVTSTSVMKTDYGWNNAVFPKTETISFRNAQYFELEKKIDQALFLSLEPVIGCPDCADGGAEWPELEINGRVKRVTFEYGSTLTGFDDLVSELRLLTEQIEVKEE